MHAEPGWFCQSEPKPQSEQLRTEELPDLATAAAHSVEDGQATWGNARIKVATMTAASALRGSTELEVPEWVADEVAGGERASKRGAERERHSVRRGITKLTATSALNTRGGARSEPDLQKGAVVEGHSLEPGSANATLVVDSTVADSPPKLELEPEPEPEPEPKVSKSVRVGQPYQ